MHLARKNLRSLALAGGLGVALALLVFALDRHPVHVAWLDDTDPEAPATDAFRDNAAPVVLVNSLENLAAAARRRDFDHMDWGLAWINLLEQEVGYYAHLEYEQVRDTSWEDRSVVIIAHSAVPRFTPEQIARLAAFAARGGVVVLDRPGEAWAALAGVRLGPGRFREGRITQAAPDVLAVRVQHALDRAGLPFPVFLHEVAGPLASGVDTLLAFDDRPALVVRPRGAGAVISTTFDVGRLLVTLQQGKPAPTYAVRKKWGFYEHVLESHDLVWHKAYLDNPIPAADVLERSILAAVRRFQPLPVWWAFPGEAMGLLLMTHDEDEKGAAQCRRLLDHERKLGVNATYFLMTGRRATDGWPPASVRRFAEQGADLALHWNRLPWQTGIWKVEPISRVFSLADQIEFYRDLLRAGGVRPGPLLNRNHYLMWASNAEFASGHTDFTRTFRIMHRHGIVMDSTYGPNRGARGYLFGTGRPFFPLDADGKRIPVWEMPFVSQENWGGEDEAWFRRLFAESQDLYHTAICCIFHPHILVRNEAGNRLWRSVYREAARHGHKAVTLRDYYAFIEARRRSPLEGRVLAGGNLQITCEARIHGLSLAVSGAPGPVRVDGAPAVRGRPFSLDGRPFTLVPVPRGKHTLIVGRSPR